MSDPFAGLIPKQSETSQLPPAREAEFQDWVRRYGIQDLDHPDSHYDYRGAFLGGATPDARGHWPDPWKQHGHETFSQESRYSTGAGDGGTWQGERFAPAGDDPFAPLIPPPMEARPIRVTAPPPPAPRIPVERAPTGLDLGRPPALAERLGLPGVARTVKGAAIDFPLDVAQTVGRELGMPLPPVGEAPQVGPVQTGDEAPYAQAGKLAAGVVTFPYHAAKHVRDVTQRALAGEDVSPSEIAEAWSGGALGLLGAFETAQSAVAGVRTIADRVRQARTSPGAAPTGIDAIANEARELSILKTRTPEQQARLVELGQALATAPRDPLHPLEESAAAPGVQEEQASRLVEGMLERDRRKESVPVPVERRAVAVEPDPFAGITPEAGAPHNDAAVQEGLFGERTLTGQEQGELIPETAGIPAARMGESKITTPDEIARVGREGTEPAGAVPTEMFGTEAEKQLERHAELTAMIGRDEQISAHHTRQYTAEGFKIKGDEPHLVFTRTYGEGYAALGRLRQAQRRLATLEGEMPPEVLKTARGRAGEVASNAAEIANRKLNGPTEEEIERAAIQAESEPVDQEALFSPAQPGPQGGRPKQPAGSSGKSDVPALIDISRKLAEAVKVPLRQGRDPALKRMALGFFRPFEEVTRVRRFDMLDTVVHEVGHFVSKKYLRNPTMRTANFRGAGPPPPKLPKDMVRELVQMGRDLYGNRKPAGGYGEEGIAQWHRFYVTDPARMLAEAPLFTKHMDGVLEQEPALKQALDQARTDFARYNALPAAQRIANQISVNERVRNMPTVRSLMTSWLDDVYEFKAAVQELGGSTSPTTDAGVLARLSRGSAGAAEEMLERGVVKYGTTTRAGPSIEKTLRSIPPEQIQAFREYLTAESALDRWARGINPGIAVEDAQAIADAGRPRFQQRAQAVWDHYQALIDYRRDAGLLTDAEAKKIKDTNPHHVSFYRVFEADEMTKGGRGAGRPFARTSSGVLRQKGSARRIVDPLESMLTDTYQTVAQVKRYEVMRELVRLARNTEGGGRIAEEVAAPQEMVTIPAEQVRSQLNAMGLAHDVKGEAFPIHAGDLEGQILTAMRELRREGPAEAKDMLVPLLENGERRWYALKDRALYDAVKGLNTPEITGLMRWLSVPVRLLRAGATLTLEFAFGRNPARDAWAQAVYTQGRVPLPGVALAEGLFHYLKADEIYQQWRLEGGDNATMLGLDRVGTKRSLDRVTASGLKRGWTIVRRPIDSLRLLSSALETATRVGEFSSVRREALRRGATPHEADMKAALAARDVTVDFAQGGTSSKAINNVVWTFNASLRGTALLLNQLRSRPATVLPRALALVTLPSLALYLMQKDDPVYQDVPAWARNVSWVYVQRGRDQGQGWDGYGTGKVEHIWVVPKPFELGILFGTVPERIAEYIGKHRPEALQNMVKALSQAFVPPVIPTAVTPLIENYANRSFGLNRPIVPRGREELAPAEQTKPGTGATARVVGKAVGYSPAKIENTVRGYTGGLGTQALRGTDAAVDAVRGLAGKPPLSPPRRSEERDPFTEVPILKGVLRRFPAEDSQRIEDTYQRFQAAEAHRLTWQRMIKEGRAPEARAYLAAHRDAIRSVATKAETGGNPGPLRVVYNELSELQKLKRTLSPSDPRRQRLLDLMRRAGAIGANR